MTRYEVDLTDEQARMLLDLWDSYDPGHRLPGHAGKAIIADAIRANPPKPPRMAEPGWGEKVIAHTASDRTRREFVRWAARSPYGWVGHDIATIEKWDDLVDPEPWRADA